MNKSDVYEIVCGSKTFTFMVNLPTCAPNVSKLLDTAVKEAHKKECGKKGCKVKSITKIGAQG